MMRFEPCYRSGMCIRRPYDSLIDESVCVSKHLHGTIPRDSTVCPSTWNTWSSTISQFVARQKNMGDDATYPLRWAYRADMYAIKQAHKSATKGLIASTEDGGASPAFHDTQGLPSHVQPDPVTDRLPLQKP